MKTAVVNRIINEKGEMLFLLRNTKPFGWGLVGGKVDPGEDNITTGIRETFEESGIPLQPEQIKVIGVEKSIDGTPVTVLETVLDHTPEVKINRGEHMSKRWITVHNAEYARNYTKEIYGLTFAGRTLDFVDLGRPVFIPESSSKW